MTVDDGRSREDVLLSSPALGLHIEPMVWSTLRDISADAAVLVLASHRYDETDYIRDYDEFLREKVDSSLDA